MKKLLALTALIVCPIISIAAEVIYCDDPAVVHDWREKAVAHGDSDDWQLIHALWLGLCAKLDDGTIEAGRAIRLFEQEHGKTMERMRREVEDDNKHKPAPAFGGLG